MTNTTELSPKERILQWARDHGVTMAADFVPFSRSRNAGEKHPSLNWRVTLLRDGKPILTTDYSAGVANCPAYKASVARLGSRDCIMRAEATYKICVAQGLAMRAPLGDTGLASLAEACVDY